MHAQATQCAAQIPVSITNTGVGKISLLYGQPQTYTATMTVPAGQPTPLGTLLFSNGTATLASTTLAPTSPTGTSVTPVDPQIIVPCMTDSIPARACMPVRFPRPLSG